MGKHLNVAAWYDVMPSGGLRRKCVSKEKETQFPLVYRQSYQQYGTIGLITLLRNNFKLSLSEAWDKTKHMFND